MATKPVFVLIPGSWHTPDVYNKTMAYLARRGFRSVGQPLASVGVSKGHTSFDEDVAAIREVLTRLVVDQGADVVLAFNSYAGMPASEAVKGLDKKHRLSQGLTGGVTRLVYINALAMAEGFQPTAGGAKFPEWMRIDLENNNVNVTAEDAREIFYNDLDADAASEWVSKLESESLGVYDSKVTYAAWRDVPSTFVIGEKDKTTITSDVVAFMLESARKEVPGAFDVVERHPDAGHCLMISQPEWLANVLRRAGGEEL